MPLIKLMPVQYMVGALRLSAFICWSTFRSGLIQIAFAMGVTVGILLMVVCLFS